MKFFAKEDFIPELVQTEIDDDIDETPVSDDLVLCPGRPSIPCDTIFNIKDGLRCPICKLNLAIYPSIEQFKVHPPLTQFKSKNKLGESEFRASLNKFGQHNSQNRTGMDMTDYLFNRATDNI